MKQKRGDQKKTSNKRHHQAVPSSSKQSNTRGGSSKVRWYIIAGMVVALGVVLYYSMSSVDYSGPKFADSERGAEKRREKERKTVNKEPNKEQSEERVEEVAKMEDSSSCEELTQGAQRLLSSHPLRTQDIDLALDMLATCALKDETQPGPRWNLAAALLQVNRSSEALPFINEALTLDPTNTNYLHDGGMVMSRLGHYRQAIRCWEKYLEIKLNVPNWGSLLERISRQREDEWEFLREIGDHLEGLLELLLNAYLREYSFIKSSCLYRVLIGLRGMERSWELIGRYAFFAYSIGDLANGIGYLQYHTEQSYKSVGYGSMEQAREIIKAHALRLFTGGIDSTIVAMIRNLLMAGPAAWDELVYHCDLKLKGVDVSTNVSLKLMKKVFASCVTSQSIVPKLLERDASVHAENIFGWTPLLQVISLDDPTIMHQILKGRADVQSRTAMGLTPLHIAAITGSSSIVLPLIQANLKPHVKDSLNRTAMDLACTNRWYVQEFAKALRTTLPHGCPIKPSYLPPLKENIDKAGGWLGSGVELPIELTREKCDIDVIGYNTQPEELISDYLTISRPVLIRNATNNKVMKRLHQLWQRGKLSKEYGHLILNEVTVPFAESFGQNQTTVKTTLRQFLDKMSQLNEKHHQTNNVLSLSPSTYIFQSIPSNSPLLQHFKVPHVLDKTKTEISTDKIQFYVGGALSGAPPHFHRTAWNTLIYGRKRWFIFPPKDSFYSREHVWDWWRDKYRNKAIATWECVQYPGDLIVLPDMWGHAVINLQESIGVASEFVYGSSEFSL